MGRWVLGVALALGCGGDVVQHGEVADEARICTGLQVQPDPRTPVLRADWVVPTEVPADAETEPTGTRRIAAEMLLGQTVDGFFRRAELDAVEAELNALYEVVPEARGIGRWGFGVGSMAMVLDAGLESRLKVRDSDDIRVRNTIDPLDTGLPELDSLNRVVGLDRLLKLPYGGAISMRFQGARDPLVLAEVYGQLDGVRAFAVGRVAGDGSELFRIERPKEVLYVLRLGSGDCPSGCIHQTHHYARLDRSTGTFTAEGTLTDAERQPEAVGKYGIPSRTSTAPYASLDELRAALHHEDWWRVLHAVRVLDAVWCGGGAPASPPFHREPDPRLAAYEAIKAEALANRRTVGDQLFALLDHPDPDVSRAVMDALLHWTGEDWTSSQKEDWSAWLDRAGL